MEPLLRPELGRETEKERGAPSTPVLLLLPLYPGKGNSSFPIILHQKSFWQLLQQSNG